MKAPSIVEGGRGIHARLEVTIADAGLRPLESALTLAASRRSSRLPRLTMVDNSDWRLQGQERYLQGVTLVKRDSSVHAHDTKWDHDHCAFCWARFMVEHQAEVVSAGYATTDDYTWMCDTCFRDFKEKFGWRLAPR
jgi:hypothetical protein